MNRKLGTWLLTGLILASCVFLSTMILQGDQPAAQFDNLERPSAIYVNKGKVYVVDFPKIHVYSATDYSLVKSFGREGEGPGDFLKFIRLIFLKDHIVAHSSGCLTYFTYSLERVKIVKNADIFYRALNLTSNGYVTTRTLPPVGKSLWDIVEVGLYDKNFNKIKIIQTQPYYFAYPSKTNAIYLPESTSRRRFGSRIFVDEGKIYIEDDCGETGNIKVYDEKNGTLLTTLKHKYPRIKVTPAHLDLVEANHKRRKKRLYQIMKERKSLRVPEFFPALHHFSIANGTIYTATYAPMGEKTRFYMFNTDGKLLKETDIPLAKEDMFAPYPFCINDHRIYQLTDTEDEIWVLKVFNLKDN